MDGEPGIEADPFGVLPKMLIRMDVEVPMGGRSWIDRNGYKPTRNPDLDADTDFSRAGETEKSERNDHGKGAEFAGGGPTL